MLKHGTIGLPFYYGHSVRVGACASNAVGRENKYSPGVSPQIHDDAVRSLERLRQLAAIGALPTL